MSLTPTFIGRVSRKGHGIAEAADAIRAIGTGAVWIDEEGDAFIADDVPDVHAQNLVGVYTKTPSPTRITNDLSARASELKTHNRATRYAA